MKIIRPDLIFSYWIYLWFILYIFKLTNYSPKFIFIIGLIENILLGIVSFYKKSKTTIKFLIMMSLMKIIPFYFVRNAPIRMIDIYFTIVLFILYIIWLHINNETFSKIQKMIFYSIVNGENKTPLIATLVYIEDKLKNFIK
jgi:hypothetical protein